MAIRRSKARKVCITFAAAAVVYMIVLVHLSLQSGRGKPWVGVAPLTFGPDVSFENAQVVRQPLKQMRSLSGAGGGTPRSNGAMPNWSTSSWSTQSVLAKLTSHHSSGQARTAVPGLHNQTSLTASSNSSLRNSSAATEQPPQSGPKPTIKKEQEEQQKQQQQQQQQDRKGDQQKEKRQKVFPSVDTISIEELRAFVARTNSEQRIFNEAKFPISAEDRVRQLVLVVQVHDRYQFLRIMLAYLKKARHISDVFLVVSSDFVNDELLSLMESIDFCQATLILCPHSIQLHPGSYPGTDPKDCPARMSQAEATAQGCLNAQSPDKYGHYREAKFSAIKIHWWWKANFVFQRLRVLGKHQGWVLLLEEDHLLAPDFVAVLHQLDGIAQSKPDIDLINLGRQRPVGQEGSGSTCSEENWASNFNNMGFALNRVTWNALAKCTDTFCDYDDYNWDWTFQLVSLQCRQKPWRTLVMDVPRVFHIGTCGIHSKLACNIAGEEEKVKNRLQASAEQLFPKELVALPQSRQAFSRNMKPNGGWGDWRDHELCRNITKT